MVESIKRLQDLYDMDLPLCLSSEEQNKFQSSLKIKKNGIQTKKLNNIMKMESAK